MPLHNQRPAGLERGMGSDKHLDRLAIDPDDNRMLKEWRAAQPVGEDYQPSVVQPDGAEGRVRNGKHRPDQPRPKRAGTGRNCRSGQSGRLL